MGGGLAMSRVEQDGQTPRPLQEYAIRKSWPQSAQRARAKPWARFPHSGYRRSSLSVMLEIRQPTPSSCSSSQVARCVCAVR
jgi:hypothetical protein